jgi:hypothetical protein
MNICASDRRASSITEARDFLGSGQKFTGREHRVQKERLIDAGIELAGTEQRG